MNFSQAVKCCLEYHQVNSKKNTVRSYETIISKICQAFGQRNIDAITTDEVLSFMNRLTNGRKQQIKKTRFSHLSSFFNFIKTNLDENFVNPCDVPMMKKLFKAPKLTH